MQSWLVEIFTAQPHFGERGRTVQKPWPQNVAGFFDCGMGWEIFGVAELLKIVQFMSTGTARLECALTKGTNYKPTS